MSQKTVLIIAVAIGLLGALATLFFDKSMALEEAVKYLKDIR